MSVKSLKLSLKNSPSRLEVAKYFRSLKSGGEKMFSLDSACIEADELLKGGEKEYCIPKYTSIAGCNAMFYALADGNVTFGRYPLYDFEKTFRNVPDFLNVFCIDDDESYERIADEDRWKQNHELLAKGADGDAQAAIDYCKKVVSGEIRYSGGCG
jgi:hypothetical protein